MEKQEPIELRSAEGYRHEKHQWMYRIPIEKVNTTGCGDIVVQVEPVTVEGRIQRLHILFANHKLPDLEGIFVIETPMADKTTAIVSWVEHFETSEWARSFLWGDWRADPCVDCGGVVFTSYPCPGTTALIVEPLKMGIGIYYELGEETCRDA